MLREIVFYDKIIVFWDKQSDFYKGCRYRVSCAGETKFTARTHCSFSRLNSDENYSVKVEISGVSGAICRTVGETTIRTLPVRRRIDVTKPPYSAVGDGKTVNTAALQKAIDDCGCNETVYLPEGVFLSGALNLHDDMELYIGKGAVLQGVCDINGYLPKRKSRFEGIETFCYSSLLNIGEVRTEGGFTCRNVTVRGEGTISGGGDVLCEKIIETEREKLIARCPDFSERAKECETMDTIPGRARPRLINVSSAQNIIFEGITIQNAPAWNLHILYSDNVAVTGCRFFSDGVRNGDGCDPDSSTNCTIFNCDFCTYDDCIAIKSGKNPEGNVINRPCKNIKIFDCRSTMGHGCSVGSEMSGGVSDIRIWDCDFEKSMFGITVKATKKRGGYVKNVFVSDCKASRLMVRLVPYNDDGEPAPELPVFENYVFENVYLTGVEWARENEQSYVPAITLTGFDREHPLKNVVLRNIVLRERADGKAQIAELNDLTGVSIENVEIK